MPKSIPGGRKAAPKPGPVKLALAMAVTAALAFVQCTSNNLSTPTGCVAYRPDAGVSGAQCAVEWACNSGSQHYQVVCTLPPGNNNYACTCSTDTSSLEKTITLNPFSCDLTGGALLAANSCGYMLEM
jgi:hypothetical protein